jgi:hypothetical protein
MDAQLANVLLVGNEQAFGIKQSDALATYDQRRMQADSDLQKAAAAAGEDATAQKALRSVLDALTAYEGLAAQTVLLDQRAHHPAGKPPAEVLTLYRQATDQLRGSVLPAVKSLTDANSSALNKTYTGQRSSIDQSTLSLWTVGIALLAALIGLQVYLLRRFHRRLNPAIALATLGTLILLIVATSMLSSESDHLKVAKKDAFDSVLALGQARATSYDANADESRFLVDPQRAAQYSQSFLDKSQQLATVPGATLETYDDQLKLNAAAAGASGSPGVPPRVHGYLGDELANLTFPGEKASALQTLHLYEVYQHDDQTLRADAKSGRLRDAVNLDTGVAPGQSNADFAAYDKALVATAAINQKYFDDAIRQGEDGLSGWTVIAPIALLVIAGLALGGVAPRLAEYR